MAIQRSRPRLPQQYRPMQDMEQFMEDFWADWPKMPSLWRRLGDGEAWMPAVDILDKKDKLVVKAELPGMKKEDIDVSVSGDLLTITGERKMEKETKKEDFYRSETAYGKFSRSLTLPVSVNADKIDATYENGVLEITLPKLEEAKAKKIEIKAK